MDILQKSDLSRENTRWTRKGLIHPRSVPAQNVRVYSPRVRHHSVEQAVLHEQERGTRPFQHGPLYMAGRGVLAR